MKITKNPAVLLMAFAACSPAWATQPNAAAAGTVSVSNAVAGNFAVGTNGSSSSYSQNIQNARSTLHSMTRYRPDYSAVAAQISAASMTESFGKAFNVSSGNASGSAMSRGHASTSAAGNAGIRGVTAGLNGGVAATQTESLIRAATNQGSYAIGQTQAGFDTQLNYSASRVAASPAVSMPGGARSAATRVAIQNTGYASGSNSSAALAGMNAAGIANIGAAGRYFAGAGSSGFGAAMSGR